jgi:hypothetical protein
VAEQGWQIEQNQQPIFQLDLSCDPAEVAPDPTGSRWFNRRPGDAADPFDLLGP